jgi:hypothetical protein
LDSRKARWRKRTATYRKTDKFKSTFTKWKEAGGREYQRQWAAAKRANQPKKLRPLTDGYVRDVLTSRSELLHPSDIPAALVAIQRDHLQLKRELNKRNK